MALKQVKSFLAIFLLWQFNCSSPSASANAIKYTAAVADQAGKFEADLPLKTIGCLKLPNGAVVFKEDQVKVMAVPDWLFDRNVVLSGPLIRAEFAIQDTQSVVAGLTYFLEGEWLTQLASPRAIDVIETVSGEQIRGRILSRVDNAFAIKADNGPTRKIEFSAIKTINSPRAFRFSIPAKNVKVLPADNSMEAEAELASFSPTFLKGSLLASKPHVPKSTLPGADPGISKASIATFLALDIIVEVAPAITIPLVLQRRTQSAAFNEIKMFTTTESAKVQAITH